MKNYQSFLIMMMLLFITFCASKPKVMISKNFKTNRAKIAILPFTTNIKDKINYSEGDKLIAYCMEMGFTVVERKKIQEIMNELQLELNGTLQDSDINKIGKILNIDMIIFGHILYGQNNSVTQTIRFVDVETGEVLISSSYETNIRTNKITREMGRAIYKRIKLLYELKAG